jgi:hypothetical protein
MHALSSAVSGAISAIENNDLQLLKTHVAAQEVICNRLSSNKGTSAPTSTGKGGNQDQTLQREISQARNALAQLNRVYAALLSRVSDSAQMIIALYRSHGEGYNRGQSALSQHHSWSCEV